MPCRRAYEKRDVVKVIVETTAYAKALVKLEEKSPDTNYWNDAGTFVVNINGVRTGLGDSQVALGPWTEARRHHRTRRRHPP